MIDVWINNGCSWNVESIESQYINISTYRPLVGSFYMELPAELRNPRKGIINIKNKKHNPTKEHSERIFKNEKKLLKNLIMIELMQEKVFNKIEVKNNICINVFGYENELVFPIYFPNQKFEDSIDLFLLIDDDK